MRNSMDFAEDFACIQRLGLDPPFAAEEKSYYSQDAGSALQFLGQLDCNPSIQSGYSSTFRLNSAAALGMTTVDSHCPSFDPLGMVATPGAHQMDNSNLSTCPHYGIVVDNSYQAQPGSPVDTNLTNAMPDLWSLFGDTSNWTELCPLTSDEFVNQSLPRQHLVASFAAATQQRLPCVTPYLTPTQQQHRPPCILPHSDTTQPPEPGTYFCRAASTSQDQIYSHSNSRRSPSDVSWQISEVMEEGVVQPFGDTFMRSGISPGEVSAISSEDSCETAVISSFVHAPHVPATSVDGSFLSVNSWISDEPPAPKKFRATNSWPSVLAIPEEWKTRSVTAIAAATSHSVSTPDPLLSSLHVENDMKIRLMPKKRQRVQDASSNAVGRMRNCHAMPSSPILCMPPILENRDPDSRHSSPSLEFTGERLKDIEQPFRARLPKLTAAVHPLEEGLSSNTYSQQSPQGYKFGRKQTATSIEPQSVAARHRRQRISERVRILESLIPGGSKLDTASMLDESIDYVRFLQLQVHLLESLNSHGIGTEWIASGACERDGAPRSSVPGRSPGCALIVSEVLQQQLFKQKLCLVSLSQVSAGRSPES